jgi:hypothetical protein
MYHVTFRVPMLVLTVPKYFHKLLQNGRLTSVTLRRKLCRIMVVTVDLPIVLVVGILRSKHGRTHTTCKVLDVILPVQGGDV